MQYYEENKRYQKKKRKKNEICTNHIEKVEKFAVEKGCDMV